LTTQDQTLISPEKFDRILKFNSPLIEAFGFITPKLSSLPDAEITNSKFSDSARIFTQDIDVYGVQPSVFDAALEDFIDPAWVSRSKLSLGD
jgi:hypothetical protein